MHTTLLARILARRRPKLRLGSGVEASLVSLAFGQPERVREVEWGIRPVVRAIVVSALCPCPARHCPGARGVFAFPLLSRERQSNQSAAEKAFSGAPRRAHDFRGAGCFAHRTRQAAVARRRPAACGDQSPLDRHPTERRCASRAIGKRIDDSRLPRVQQPLSQQEIPAIGSPVRDGSRRRDGRTRIGAAISTLRRCYAPGVSMLVFTRRVGESFVIDSPAGLITVKVISLNHKARIGIEAPSSVRVDRQEVHEIPPALRRDGRRVAG